MGFDAIINALLSQGGVWAALFLLAALTAAYLYRELRGAEERCAAAAHETAKALADLHEKRLDEAKLVLTALERNTTSSATRAVALESINTSLAKLVEGFTILTQAQDSRGERCREQMDRLERNQTTILDRVREAESHHELSHELILQQLGARRRGQQP